MSEFVMRNNEVVPKLTIEKFFNGGREVLSLEVLAGHSGFPRVIPQAFFHRPGLAIAGFFEHFPAGRIQVVGATETAYLNSLSPERRVQIWRRLFEAGVVCAIVTQPLALPPEVPRLAEEFKAVLLKSALPVPELIARGLLVLHDQTAPQASLHGTMVGVAGVGVLLTGEPGVGKSETALGLVRRGATLIADDMTKLTVSPYGVLMGRPVPYMAAYMEIRGLGLLHIPSLYGVAAVRSEMPLDLIVTLLKTNPEGGCDCTGADVRTWSVLGRDVAHQVVPVVPGRDFVNIVETAAFAHRMRAAGIDAAASLDECVKAHHRSVGVKNG